MHPKSLKLLDDISEAATFIGESTASVSLSVYQSDRMLRSAVERNFEIIGEALIRPEQLDWATVEQISDYRKMIGFRKRLAPGYDAIDKIPGRRSRTEDEPSHRRLSQRILPSGWVT